MTSSTDSQSIDPDQIERLLDRFGIGFGPVIVRPIGDGHSNLTFLLTRGNEHRVLRRPPRPPYPPSAHDVLREAMIVDAAGAAGLPVPAVLATIDAEQQRTSPFVPMEFIDGVAISNDLSDPLSSSRDRARIGPAMISTLGAVHDVDPARTPLAGHNRGAGYLERQLRRFAEIHASTGTGAVRGLAEVGDWLSAYRPGWSETTLVHGDFRLGNVLFAKRTPAHVVAVLDWELAALGTH
jgi:aminoglycoside phosphotransferase (APT) family kinase protein